ASLACATGVCRAGRAARGDGRKPAQAMSRPATGSARQVCSAVARRQRAFVRTAPLEAAVVKSQAMEGHFGTRWFRMDLFAGAYGNAATGDRSHHSLTTL